MPDTIRCFATGQEREAKLKSDGELALPQNWKQIDGQVYSPAGIKEKFTRKAIDLPIASVVVGHVKDPHGEEDRGQVWTVENTTAGWKELRQCFRASSDQCRWLLSWAFREMAKADNEPLTKTDKGWKLPKFSATEAKKPLYALARALYPEVDSQTVSTLLQKVPGVYTATRFHQRVLGKKRIPEFLHPVPVPIQQKDARLTVTEQKQPFLRVRVHGQRFTLRLKTKNHSKRYTYAAKIKALQTAITKGDVGEAAIRQRRKDGVLFATIAVLIPKEPIDRKDVTIRVKTSTNRLFEVFVGDREEPWNLNDDQIKRQIAAYRRRSLRISEDRKFERRFPSRERAKLNRVSERRADKQNAWLTDRCRKAAKIIANLAQRHKASLVQYDDRETGFAESFPWFKLRQLIEQNLVHIGVKLEHVGNSDENGTE